MSDKNAGEITKNQAIVLVVCSFVLISLTVMYSTQWEEASEYAYDTVVNYYQQGVSSTLFGTIDCNSAEERERYPNLAEVQCPSGGADVLDFIEEALSDGKLSVGEYADFKEKLSRASIVSTVNQFQRLQEIREQAN